MQLSERKWDIFPEVKHRGVICDSVGGGGGGLYKAEPVTAVYAA